MLLDKLLSYNHNDNKSLCAYFFGSVNDNQCEQIIELYRLKGVSIKQFIDTPNGIIIKTVLDTNVTNKNEQDDFHSWLDENIEYKENSVFKFFSEKNKSIFKEFKEFKELNHF